MNKSILVALVLGLMVMAPIVRADPPATQPTIEQIIKAKGLVENGFLIVLPDEAGIHAQVRALRSDKVKIANETAGRAGLEKSIKDSRDQLQVMYAQSTALNDRLAASSQGAGQNQLVGAVNSLINRIKQKETDVEEMKEREGKLPDSRTDYITLAQDLPNKADAAVNAYQTLARDEQLTGAITDHNQTATLKLKLGPSGLFQEDLKFIRQVAGEVLSEVVPVNSDSGVPTVEVLLNGKLKERMIWDSGDSIVTLTATTADKLGLHPAKTDPTLDMKVADGRTVKARLMHLDTVRVGAFSAKDVECVIMPRAVKGIGDLLGDTFQSHFVCRMDLTKGELHLTPLDAQDAGTKAKDAATGPGK